MKKIILKGQNGPLRDKTIIQKSIEAFPGCASVHIDLRDGSVRGEPDACFDLHLLRHVFAMEGIIVELVE